MKRLCITVGCLVVLVGTVLAGPVGSVFNPADYPILRASLNVNSGSIVIDTKNGTNAPTMVTVIGTETNIYSGIVVSNQSGQVWLALFNFGNVSIGSGVSSISITGNLGLVLGSLNNLSLAKNLSMIGGAATQDGGGNPALGGAGAPGAEGGVRTVSYKSNPPPSNKGLGGTTGRVSGIGYGGGSAGQVPGGGGYGGRGASCLPSYGSISGSVYGDSSITNLFGGSGGGGNDGSMYGCSGGGGGSVELVANGILTLSSIVSVKGGVGASWDGGGGSGGGVILAAPILNVTGTVDASGGNGFHIRSGDEMSGGGGGRVAWYYRQKISGTSANVNVTRGTSFFAIDPIPPAFEADVGTFYEGSFPFPSGVVRIPEYADRLSSNNEL